MSYAKHLEEQEAQKAKSMKGMKDICQVLFKADITNVEVNYNGCGDEGSIEHVLFFQGDKQLDDGEIASLDLPTYGIERWVSGGPGSKGSNVSGECTIVEKIEDYAYDFLPLGFEINEGSYGDLKINTETAKVTREHNENIFDVNYSEEEYQL